MSGWCCNAVKSRELKRYKKSGLILTCYNNPDKWTVGMKCPKCGKELTKSVSFCGNCGSKFKNRAIHPLLLIALVLSFIMIVVVYLNGLINRFDINMEKAVMSFYHGDLPYGDIINKNIIKREEYFKMKGFEDVFEIGEYNVGGGAVGISGQKKALFINDNRIIKEVIYSKFQIGYVTIVDLNNDGQYEFIQRYHGFDPYGFIDSKGAEHILYGAETVVDDLAAGDIYGTGKNVIVFADSSSVNKGINVIDEKGIILSKITTDPATRLFLEDVNGDGRKEIIYSASESKIYVRDYKGTLLSGPISGYEYFSMTNWFGEKNRKNIVSMKGTMINVADYKGNKIGTLDIGKIPEENSEPYLLTGTAFKGKSGNNYYACTIRFFSGEDRARNSFIYIFDEKGEVIYLRKISSICESLLVKDGCILAGDEYDEIGTYSEE